MEGEGGGGKGVWEWVLDEKSSLPRTSILEFHGGWSSWTRPPPWEGVARTEGACKEGVRPRRIVNCVGL